MESRKTVSRKKAKLSKKKYGDIVKSFTKFLTERIGKERPENEGPAVTAEIFLNVGDSQRINYNLVDDNLLLTFLELKKLSNLRKDTNTGKKQAKSHSQCRSYVASIKEDNRNVRSLCPEVAIFNEDLCMTMQNWLDGHSNYLCELAKEGKFKSRGGAKSITFEQLRSIITNLFFKLHRPEDNLVQLICFALFMWVLISRSKSVATINIKTMTWELDNLISDILNTKGKRSINDLNTEKAMYGNSDDPTMDVIMWFALHVSMRTQLKGSNYNLFDSNIDIAFTGYLKWAWAQVPIDSPVRDDLYNIIEIWRAHGIRKGIMRFLTTVVDGPPLVSTMIRADKGGDFGDSNLTYIGLGESR